MFGMSKKSPGYCKRHRKLGIVINPCFCPLCHKTFCMLPIFEPIERASYRVRFSLTVGFPTDVKPIGIQNVVISSKRAKMTMKRSL